MAERLVSVMECFKLAVEKHGSDVAYRIDTNNTTDPAVTVSTVSISRGMMLQLLEGGCSWDLGVELGGDYV